LQGRNNEVIVKGGKNETRNRRKCSNAAGGNGGVALARKIETFAVPIYFLLFVLFNIVYWPWIMGSSNFFKWSLDTTHNVAEDPEF